MEMLLPKQVFTTEAVGISAPRPVQVWSHVHSSDEPRTLLPGHPDHPGPAWGGVSRLTAEHDSAPPHRHEFCEITLIRRGTARYHATSGRRSVRPGTIVVVPKGEVQYYDHCERLAYTNIYYLPEWLADDLQSWWAEAGLVHLFLAPALYGRSLLSEVPCFELTVDELAQIDRELEDLVAELMGDGESLVLLKGAFLKLLVRVCRAYAKRRPDLCAHTFRREVWYALGRIERLVTTSEPLDVESIAQEVGLSHKRLCLVFKRDVGSSVTDYFQRRRAQHAARLLLDLRSSITHVAHGLGYYDSAHFTNLFRRYYGVTPGAYRKQFTQAFASHSMAHPTLPWSARLDDAPEG